MYCERCGKKNEDGKKFCQYCGAPLSGRPGRPAGAKKGAAFRMKPLYWMIVVEGVLLGLLLVGCYFLGSHLYGPDAAVRSYVEAGLDGDWSRAYGWLDADSSLSENRYLSAHAGDKAAEYTDLTIREKEGTVDREIRRASVSGETAEDFREYEVRCQVNGESLHSTVIAVKTGYRKAFLFDEWKIVAVGMYGTDVPVTLPVGSTLLLNGQEADLAAVSSENGSYYETYRIPELFYGTYQAEIVREGMETCRIVVDYQGEGGEFDFSGITLMPDQETMNTLTEQFSSDYETILGAALTGQDFDTISALFSEEALEEGEVEYLYENLQSTAYDAERGRGLTRIEMGDLSMTFISPGDSYVGEPEDVVMNIDGTVSTYHSYDGMTEEENSDSASWTVAYHLEDGVWKLQNFQW